MVASSSGDFVQNAPVWEQTSGTDLYYVLIGIRERRPPNQIGWCASCSLIFATMQNSTILMISRVRKLRSIYVDIWYITR